jgi:hypothetical protein
MFKSARKRDFFPMLMFMKHPLQILISATSLIITQESMEKVKSLSQRILVLTISACVLLTTTYYQTMLLGSLMVQSPPSPPMSSQVLINRMENKQMHAIFHRANSSVERVLRLSKKLMLAIL